MNVAILIFDKLTALDAIGPYEVLSRVPGWELTFVAKEPGPKRTDTGHLAITADASIGELADPDIVLVPGGEGNRPLLTDDEVLDWLRRVHETSKWTTSVCTGSLVLAAAGILDGLEATSHWAYLDRLAEGGATPVKRRFVEDGKVMTAAGVSAGIDMALHLVARETHEDVARAIQLGIEYDPDPPFDSGAPEKAKPELVEMIRSLEARGEAAPAA
ncbi:MAG TPA: DJ-1/PfpI family protein [Solirubrobacterales bacterium]